MACDWACQTQYILDILVLISIFFYITVIAIIMMKKTFNYSFTSLAISLAVADITYSVFLRLYYVFPIRLWFK